MSIRDKSINIFTCSGVAFDFNKELYAEKICVNLLSRIRDEQKFNSLDEFIQNVQTRITNLEAKLQNTKDKEEKQRLVDRIEGLTSGKQDILIHHSLNKFYLNR